MYCPKCGTRIRMEDQLFGGVCSHGCSNCRFAMNCRDFFTKEIREETRPIYNHIKAWKLRRNFRKGQRRVKKS